MATQSAQSEHNASIVEQFTQQAAPFSKMATQQEELLLEFSGVSNKDTVLDVACGPGIVACVFATCAHHVIGIDLTPAMLEQARKRQAKMQLENLTWQQGDVLSLPFADDSFSMVITRYSFHHFLDPQSVLAEMLRVCQPGGTVLVVDATPAPEKAAAYNHVEKLKDPSHVRALTEDELLTIIRASGLQQIRTQAYDFEIEYEASMKSFFPHPGDEAKIRQMFFDDADKDALGLRVHFKGTELHYVYPVLMVAGQKKNQYREQ